MPPLALLAPLGAVLIWSGNMTINQLTVGTIAPSSIAFLRWVLALLVLTPFVLPRVWQERDEIRRQWWRLAILGLLGMALWQGLAYMAAATTSATNMGILAAMVPLLTILISALVLREAPTWGGIIGGIMALAGVLWLLSRGNLGALSRLEVASGDGLMVVAAICYALYGVMLKRWAMPLSPWVMLYMQAVFATLLLLPGYLSGPMTPISSANIGLILYAGIPASIITTYLWMTAIRHLGASRSSIFINLMPVFSALIAMLWLDERLAAHHLSGGVLVLCGVLLAQLVNRPLTRSPTHSCAE